jgi:hypothetical protein
MVLVDTRTYQKVELSYAVTSFRSQGGTFDETHVFLGGVGSSRQMAYVVGSRERDSVRFYADRFEAGCVLEWLSMGNEAKGKLESPLARDMEKSAEKLLAHDLKVERALVPAQSFQYERTREY